MLHDNARPTQQDADPELGTERMQNRMSYILMQGLRPDVRLEEVTAEPHTCRSAAVANWVPGASSSICTPPKKMK